MTYTRELLEDARDRVSLKLTGTALEFEIVMQRRSGVLVELSTPGGSDSPEAGIIRDATLSRGRNGLDLNVPVPNSVVILGRGGSVRSVNVGGSGMVIQGGSVQFGSGNVQVNQFGFGRNRVSVGGNALVLEYGIKVTVYLPEYSDVLCTKGSGLHITGPAGMIETDFSGGDVVFEQAGELDIRTSGGDIQGGYVAGRAKVRTSGGDIEIEEIRGGVELETSGGDIEVGVAHGDGSMRTSGGNVKLREFTGARMSMRTSGGNIKHPNHRGIEARTSGGRINGKSAW